MTTFKKLRIKNKIERLPFYDKEQKFLVLDYETFSEADIKKVGSYEYSMHPSTEVLCVSWAHGTREELKKYINGKKKVKSWAPKKPWNKHIPHHVHKHELCRHLKDPDTIIIAHNALFEQAITRNVLTRHLSKSLGIKGPWVIPHERFFCTAALSSVYALPRKLEGVTAALKLKHQKDAEGHRLMMRWAKPKKPSKKDPSTRYTQNFERLVQYCEHDIYAEVNVFLRLPPLIPSELRLWYFDQTINFRGAKVDRDLVEKILKMIAEEKKFLTSELQRLTGGAVQTGGQRDKLLAWLRKKKVKLPDLKAKTVDDAIKGGKLPADVATVLDIRQKLNKTSLKKYSAFMNHTTSDSFMRFSLNFNATVHGRWGGAGVQPHNFPRGTLKHKDEEGKEHDLATFAAEMIKDGATLEMIRLAFGDPMEVFVSCLRTMIVAEEGDELFVSDFSAIEARVLFWLSNHNEGMKAFREKRKMYEELAMVIFKHTSISQVTKDERFVGKQAFLGSGYGMGWPKFKKTCADFGQDISDVISKNAIKGYRDLHAPVPKLWTNLEACAIKAVQNPGKTFKINYTEWFMQDKFLVCRLPSKRCLYYYGAEVKYQRTPWGTKKPILYHWTVDSKTRKWCLTKTWGGVLTQNCVGGISRDLLASAMRRHEKAGYKVILTVHDEIIATRKIGEGNLEEFDSLMRAVPKWAEGCPVEVEGWKSTKEQGHRYHK